MRFRWGRILLALLVLLLACAGIAQLLGRSLPGEVGQLGRGLTDTLAGAGEEGAAPDRSSGDAVATARARAVSSRADDLGAAPREGAGAARSPAAGDLPPFRVLTLQYTPYMATLVHMAAGGYLERRGYGLELVDVYAEEVGLDEQGQCDALREGRYDALATTLDATRKCGAGVAVAIPIGQSAGNDAIVVKPGVETWSDIFEHAIAFTGYSVSEYMACFASHTSARRLDFPLRFDDASQAVDAFIESGPERDVSAVVAWEPEVDRALAAVPGSRVILSSRDVRILWDVLEVSSARLAADPAAYAAFTAAYYEALADLARDPAGAYGRMAAWAGDDPARLALLSADDADAFVAQLDLEAFATLRDAAFLMDDRRTLLSRLEEAEFYWSYCGEAVPPVADPTDLLAPDLVLTAKKDGALQPALDARPGRLVFQSTDFTDPGAVRDPEIEQAQKLFETGVDIEFVANRTDFRDPAAAERTLRDAVRFLRTCRECFLEVEGSSAYPGGAFRRSFTEADADALAIDRGRAVYDQLRQRFDVPDAQLLFVETPRVRKYPGSVVEEELREDRRTYLTGYKMAGGM